MATLPPGMSEQDFSAAMRRFREVVGDDWLFTSDEDVALYKDAYSPIWQEEEERVASAAVAPDTVEEVQAIVEIANEYQLPLYPLSTGKNLTYGGSAPSYSGSVVVDLKRMNRILDVNERDQTCLVEPGVSYFDLYRHLRKNNMKLWIDCPDPGWGSLVGNALDHGGGYTGIDFRDHFDAHCGMEVVLGSGELIRTGMGANEKSHIWQLYKHSFGPTVDGLFAQSNFGIVTKMGFWLMEEPEQCLAVTVTAFKRRDIVAFMEVLTSLMNAHIVSSQTTVFSPVMSTPTPEFIELISKDSTDQEWDDFANGAPFWVCTFSFYGAEKIINANWEYTKERFSIIPGIQFLDGVRTTFPLTDEEVEASQDKPRMGIPSLDYFSSRNAPGALPSEGHMDFAAIIAPNGEEILTYATVLARAYIDAGRPPSFLLIQMYHARVLTMFQVVSTHRDKEKNRESRELFEHLITICAEHGWTVYRAHTHYQDFVMKTYDFNDNALLKLNEKLKDAVDPNGIISAGRYGIWPKHLRGSRG